MRAQEPCWWLLELAQPPLRVRGCPCRVGRSWFSSGNCRGRSQVLRGRPLRIWGDLGEFSFAWVGQWTGCSQGAGRADLYALGALYNTWCSNSTGVRSWWWPWPVLRARCNCQEMCRIKEEMYLRKWLVLTLALQRVVHFTLPSAE